jgi:hypothetical protein
MSQRLTLIPIIRDIPQETVLKSIDEYEIINIKPFKSESSNTFKEIETEEPKTNRKFIQTTDRPNIHRRSTKKLSIISQLKSSQLIPILNFLKETIREETELEDESKTKFYFSKIKYDEIISAIFTINAVIGSIIYYEVKQMLVNHDDYLNNPTHDLCLKVTLIFITINTLLYSNLH